MDWRLNEITDLGRTDKELSGRVGLVYKPLPNGSVYAAYGTSFNPSSESLALSPSDVNLEPESSRTYEIGTKWDLLNKKLAVNAAVFRTEKTNARTVSLVPDDPERVLDGEQVVQGFEIGFAGRVTRNWSVFGGYLLS
jgi:catecholate siderophore receptor